MITVIIPTYKPSDYIEELLECLSKQTLQSDAFEILIILNGDKDPYIEFLQNILIKQDIRNCSILYSSVSGVSNARNLGLKKAKGEYIIFIDDDDLVSMNYIESLRNNVTESSICVSNEKCFKTSLQYLEDGYLTNCFANAQKHMKYNLLNMRSYLSTACFKIIPVSIIGENKFDITLQVGEDSLFMASISCNIEKIHMANEDVIYYRRLRHGSASRKGYSFSYKLLNVLKLYKRYSCIYFSNPLKYNFLFFLSRFFAVLKSNLLNL